MSCAELSRRLGTSTSWVKAHARELGGQKVERVWSFPAEAVRMGLELIQSSGFTQTVIHACRQCEQEIIGKRGRLGRALLVYERCIQCEIEREVEWH